MRIDVDFDKCASNGVCMGIAPQIFEVREDGYLYVLDENPSEDFRDKMIEAQDSCPTQAITIVD